MVSAPGACAWPVEDTRSARSSSESWRVRIATCTEGVDWFESSEMMFPTEEATGGTEVAQMAMPLSMAYGYRRRGERLPSATSYAVIQVVPEMPGSEAVDRLPA